MFAKDTSHKTVFPVFTSGGGFGMPEMIIILVIVLVVFGAGKLPEIGGALGKSIRNFKKAADGKDEIEIKPKNEDSDKKP